MSTRHIEEYCRTVIGITAFSCFCAWLISPGFLLLGAATLAAVVNEFVKEFNP